MADVKVPEEFETPILEEWRTPEGYAPYQVSNLGRIRGKKGVYITGAVDAAGYRVSCLSLTSGKKMVKHHRLIALAFIPNPDNRPHVNHRNGIRTCNCVPNLEWVTAAENGARKVFVNPNRDMTNCRQAIEQISQMGKIVQIWESQTAAARNFGISAAGIIACCKGTQVTAAGFRWRKVNKPVIENLENEEWRDLTYKDYPYGVSNMGRIRLRTGGITLGSARAGYLNCNATHLVHRLVAIAFIDNPEQKPYVNHKDGNGEHNWVDNLEWATAAENTQHAVATGLKMASNNYKRPILQLKLDGQVVATYASIIEASRTTGHNAGNIGSACRGVRYNTVGGFRWAYGEVDEPQLTPENTPAVNPNTCRPSAKMKALGPEGDKANNTGAVPDISDDDPVWVELGIFDALYIKPID